MFAFNLVGTFLSLVATGAAAVAAWFAWQAVKVEAQPYLALVEVEARPEDPNGHGLRFHFQNVGKGCATALAVDLDTEAVSADIGSPISAGPGGRVYVHAWLPHSDTFYRFRLMVHYWDMADRGFATEVSVLVRWSEQMAESGAPVLSSGHKVYIQKGIATGLKPPKMLLDWRPVDRKGRLWPTITPASPASEDHVFMQPL